MRVHRTAGVALLVLAPAVMAVTATAQQGDRKNGLVWATRLSETRGPIRTADVSAPPGRAVSSEILGGPANLYGYVCFLSLDGCDEGVFGEWQGEREVITVTFYAGKVCHKRIGAGSTPSILIPITMSPLPREF